jgi:hypothetical protein
MTLKPHETVRTVRLEESFYSDSNTDQSQHDGIATVNLESLVLRKGVMNSMDLLSDNSLVADDSPLIDGNASRTVNLVTSDIVEGTTADAAGCEMFYWLENVLFI